MKHCGTQRLETDRLILRRYEIEDAAAMFKSWASDPEVTKFLMWKTHSNQEESQRIMNDWVKQYSNEKYYHWGITLKENGDEPIGAIAVGFMNEEVSSTQISYCLGRAWWHQGIMSEALKAVMDFFKGGVAAFGYDLVKSGRFNKRKHELYDLKVNPDEATVVRIIFDKYTTEGYGAHRITTWLNNNGYRARTGKMWHEATIRGILCNLTYTGVLRSGDSRSEVIPELQIISPEQFERARMIMQERSDRKKENPTVPLNTKGKSLISGKVYCGHCGSRLNLTTSGRYRKRKDGTVDTTKRIRYACYGKSRKQTECNGQSGYTLHILDDLIDEIIRDIFKKMKGVSKNDVVMSRYANELEVRKARHSMLKAAYGKEFENLTILKSEVIKAIKGESSFSADTLSELIEESEKECSRLLSLDSDAEKDVADGESVLKNLTDSFDELISWAELYNEASFEKKKMIVNCLIKRVEVSRGYKLNIEFNIDFEQFMMGLDKVA